MPDTTILNIASMTRSLPSSNVPHFPIGPAAVNNKDVLDASQRHTRDRIESRIKAVGE
jgi:hypothetical protein